MDIDIKFLANTFDGKNEITEQAKKQYIYLLNNVLETFCKDLEIESLSVIYIPENYMEELKQYQESHGKRAFVTNNEYGRGFAQQLEVIENGNTKITIFVEKMLVFGLATNEMLSMIKESQGEEMYEQGQRQLLTCVNLIRHECAHVQEAKQRKTIPWILKKREAKNLHDNNIVFALNIWQEYYACRMASNIGIVTIDSVEETVETLLSAEDKIQEERKKYNYSQIGLNEFVLFFNEYVQFLLVKIVYLHGNIFFHSESERLQLIDIIEDKLSGTNAKSIWSNLGAILDKLYCIFPIWEDEDVLQELVDCISEYVNNFDIYISQQKQAIYYDIPVHF